VLQADAADGPDAAEHEVIDRLLARITETVEATGQIFGDMFIREDRYLEDMRP
jgi:hypothetical protein